MANGAAQPTGIMTRKYKSGSIIYFEGDKSEFIYILKSGRVILTSIKPDTGEEVKEDVRKGEFFGVKSSLGKYPREETAQTIGDTTVLIMSLAEFERLILRNVNVVRKMLRVFSNQLRRIGKMVRSVLGEGEDMNPEVELFRIGEYYLKEGQYDHALYAYKKYMEYYPDMQYSSVSMKRINDINSGAADPSDAGMGVVDGSGPGTGPGFDDSGDDFNMEDSSGMDDMLDFDDGAGSSGGTDDFEVEVTHGAGSSLAGEMDDFLSDDKTESFDDFGFDNDAPAAGGGSTIFEMDHEAFDLFIMGNFAGSLELYEKITQTTPGNDEEKNIVAKAHYEAGRCHMELKNARGALEMFSKLIKDFPGTEHIKSAAFQIGSVFESAGQKEKALSYYTKVLNMTPKDTINSEAFSRIKNLQGR